MTDPAIFEPAGSPVVRLWNLVWLGDNSEELEDLLTETFVRHTRDGTAAGTPAAYRRTVGKATRNTTGTEVRVERLEHTDDHVYARITLLGVHLTTGEPTTIATIGDYRLSGGRIAEIWLMHQVGLDWR